MPVINNRNLMKKFKDVFSDYSAFSTWWNSTPFRNIIIDEITFTLIAYEYNDSTLTYTEEGFKQHFAIDLYTYAKEFQETTRAIDELMQVTDEEIATAESMITNFAEIPETVNSTNVEEVDFVSNQQKVINKKGILKIKKEQLGNKRTYTTKTFLKRFKHLFIMIYSSGYVPVFGEPEGEDL